MKQLSAVEIMEHNEKKMHIKVIEDKRYSIDYVFSVINNALDKIPAGILAHKKKNAEYDIIIDGFRVHPFSLRYQTFMNNGVVCVKCGRRGTHFKLCGDADSNRRHFNLYADDGTLITKDHIIPVSKGGKDHISNFQTMCEPCNAAKGNKL